MTTNTYSKRLYISFKQFLSQIRQDAMLFIVCFTPILSGLLIKFGIPFAEKLLIRQFGFTELITPYYLVFDLLLAVLTPLMFCFVSAMVMLGEIDDGISNYLSVTPLGKRGYLISRLGIPTFISFVVTITTLILFSLNKHSLVMIVGISILVAMIGLIISMLVISMSSNKVEGMAVTKLSGLFIIGIPIPFFITGGIQYILCLLPSFWLSKYAIDQNPIYFIICILISIVWIILLYKKFIRKIN